MSDTTGVPVERVRALVRLLFPDEMTPHAARLIERVCDEYDPAKEDDRD